MKQPRRKIMYARAIRICLPGPRRYWLQYSWGWQPRFLFFGIKWKAWPAAIELHVCPFPSLLVTIYLQRNN